MDTSTDTLPGLAPGKAWRMCITCGALRQVGARFRGERLNCHGECHGPTPHALVGLPWGDHREAVNRKQDNNLRLFAATEAMLEALGIELWLTPLEKEFAAIWSEIDAEGDRRIGITLDANLTLEDQAWYLQACWRDLLPLNEPRWADDERWMPVDDEPGRRQLILVWLKEGSR